MTAALDDATFEALAQRHRRELHVHCYRMLASFDEAEDAVQETLLRAWRARERLRRRRARPRLALPHRDERLPERDPVAHPAHVVRRRRRGCSPTPTSCSTRSRRATTNPTPSPSPRDDRARVPRRAAGAAAAATRRAARPRRARHDRGRDGGAARHQRRRGQQRAATRPRRRCSSTCPRTAREWSAHEPSADERALLARFIDAHERCDAAAAVAIAATDIRVTMPPLPMCFDGLDAVGDADRATRSARTATATGGSCRRWRTGCRRRPATCAGPATRSSARSSSTCCASRAARSPRSPRSAPRCFLHWGSRRRSADQEACLASS